MSLITKEKAEYTLNHNLDHVVKNLGEFLRVNLELMDIKKF
jgi:hypothetical protein